MLPAWLCHTQDAACCLAQSAIRLGDARHVKLMARPACRYNLPETVRESDIEKLSFAVQLAEGFYANTQARSSALRHLAIVCLNLQGISAWLKPLSFL